MIFFVSLVAISDTITMRNSVKKLKGREIRMDLGQIERLENKGSSLLTTQKPSIATNDSSHLQLRKIETILRFEDEIRTFYLTSK